MKPTNHAITDIRKKIDVLDQQILQLLNERAQCTLAIGKIKILQEGHEVEFYRPEREAQVLKNISQQNAGPLSAKSIITIFRAIMTECRQLETLHTPERKS